MAQARKSKITVSSAEKSLSPKSKGAKARRQAGAVELLTKPATSPKQRASGAKMARAKAKSGRPSDPPQSRLPKAPAVAVKPSPLAKSQKPRANARPRRMPAAQSVQPAEIVVWPQAASANSGVISHAPPARRRGRKAFALEIASPIKTGEAFPVGPVSGLGRPLFEPFMITLPWLRAAHQPGVALVNPFDAHYWEGMMRLQAPLRETMIAFSPLALWLHALTTLSRATAAVLRPAMDGMKSVQAQAAGASGVTTG